MFKGCGIHGSVRSLGALIGVTQAQHPGVVAADLPGSARNPGPKTPSTCAQPAINGFGRAAELLYWGSSQGPYRP